MGDNTKVNSQVLHGLQVNQQATMVPGILQAAGAGKAYQAVAQSAAMAVQDAADHLRNMGTLSSTVIGTAFSHSMTNPELFDTYKGVIGEAQKMMDQAAIRFENIGGYASQVLQDFQRCLPKNGGQSKG